MALALRAHHTAEDLLALSRKTSHGRSLHRFLAICCEASRARPYEPGMGLAMTRCGSGYAAITSKGREDWKGRLGAVVP